MLRAIEHLAPEGGWVRETIRKLLLAPKVPAHLAERFTQLDKAGAERLKNSLVKNFFSRQSADYLATPRGRQDLADHLTGRLESDRRNIIAWLDSVQALAGSRILEIGCGTGASTIALAEQGARVIGLDIDTVALKDAAERCRIYGLDVSFMTGNAAGARNYFSPGQFDLIIFYAALEHMTHGERITALGGSWALLPPGGVLAVVDTPNRLWYFDSHTALAPFFHWLPDDVALEYARLCPRETFNKAFLELSDTSYVELMRWGRGVSFHEFELAIDKIELNSSVSCNSSFARQKRLFNWLKWRLSSDRNYEMLLRRLRPDVHMAFFQPYLNLTIRKPMQTRLSST